MPIMAEDLHKALVTVSRHADKWGWRQQEMSEVEGILPDGTFVARVERGYSPRHIRRLREREAKERLAAFEADRFRAEGEKWRREQLEDILREEREKKLLEGTTDIDSEGWGVDPNAPKNWSGDLSKRYVDETELDAGETA
jgi:hypothetical protein